MAEADRREHLIAGLRERSTWGHLAEQWIREASGYAGQVASAATPDPAEVALFWVRLVGVLGDIRKWLHEANQKAPASMRPTCARLIAGIASVRACLSEDELLYAEYRRHVECHPFQNAYDPIDHNKEAKVSFPSRILERRLPLLEVGRRIEDLIRAHGADEMLIGTVIAQRLAPQLDRLRAEAAPINRPDAMWI